MSSKSNSFKKSYKQNKVNRVTKKNKEYGGKAPSKSQQAYINGNVGKSAEGGAYYIKQQRKEGKRAYGYEHDDLYTGGRKASNYKKLKNGENPYEARYLAQKGSKTIPGGTYKDSGKKYGARKVSNNRLLTKDEKASFNKYGRLNHAEFKPKEKYIDWDNEREVGGKFEDRLKFKKLDGMAIAKANQRKGKHLSNAIEYGKGFLKDTIGDAGGDLLKIGDRVASSAMAGAQGALEQSGNVFKGIAEGNMKEHYNKGLVKRMVDKNLKESDETGWGLSAGANIREMMERQNPNKELTGSDKIASTVAGTALDLSNPVDLISGMFKVGGKGLKGALASIDDMRKGTTDLSNAFVPKSFTNLRGKGGNISNTPSKASDEVFFPSDNIKQQLVENKHKGFNAEDYNLDKAFERSVDKVDNIKQPKIVTDKPVIDNFLTELEVKTSKQRNIDGRTLNKKYTQTKDGYVPNLLNNVDEIENIKNLPNDGQMSMFNKMNNEGGMRRQDVVKENRTKQYSNNLDRLNDLTKHDFSINKPNLIRDKNVFESVLSIKSKEAKRPKNVQIVKENIDRLNDVLFEGKPIINKDANYGYVRELVETLQKGDFEDLSKKMNSYIGRGLSDPNYNAKRSRVAKESGIGKFGEYTDKIKEYLKPSEDYAKLSRKANDLQRLLQDPKNTHLSKELSDVKNQLSKVDIEDIRKKKSIAEKMKLKVKERNELAQTYYNMNDADWVKHINSTDDPLNVYGKNESVHTSIKDLINSGQLDDNAKRTNINPSENFVQSHSKIKKSDDEVTNQELWKIASSQNGNKSVGYYNKVIESKKSDIGRFEDEIAELMLDAMMGDKDAKLTMDKLSFDVKKINSELSDLSTNRKKVIDNFKDIKNRLSGESDPNIVISELKRSFAKEDLDFRTRGEKKFAQEFRKKNLKYVNYDTLGENVPSKIKGNYNSISKTKGFSSMFENMKKLMDIEVNKIGGMQDTDTYKFIRDEIKNYVKILDKVGVDKNVYFGEMKKHKLNLQKQRKESMKNITTLDDLTKPKILSKTDRESNAIEKLAKKISVDDDYEKILNSNNVEDLFESYNTKNYKDYVAQAGDNISSVKNTKTSPLVEDGRKLKLKNDLPFEKLKNPSERIDPKNLGGIDYSKVPESIPSKQKFKKEPIPDNVNEYGEIIGSFKPNVDVPKTTPLDSVAKDVPKIGDDIAQELTEHGVKPNTKPPKEKPKDMSPSLYKRWMTSYKRGVTQFNPGWHIQNYFQNKGQNYLSMGNKAFAPQTEAKKLRKAIINNESNNPLVDMAKELNVMGGFGEDVGVKGLTKLGDKMQQAKIFDKLGASEETARLHHWIDRLDKGDTPEQALKSVNKYLFDYSKANKFDKGMKNIDPFWTFHSQNAKLMGESVFTNNGKMGNIKRAMDGFQQEIPEDEKQAKDSMYRDIQAPGKSMKDSVNKQQYNYLYDNDTLPSLKDALPPLDGTGEWAKTKLNPLIQMGLQLAKKENGFGNEVVDNKEEFNLSDMSKYFYEDSAFGTTSEGRWIKDMAKTINPILPTLVNTLDKQHDANLKVDKKKQSRETSDKQILNEWIKQLTGHKGNWYKNIK